MKLVSWYDNEWGYRYSPSLLSVRETDYITEVVFLMVSDNCIFLFLLQQSSVGPHRAHGIGSGPQLNSKIGLLLLLLF